MGGDFFSEVINVILGKEANVVFAEQVADDLRPFLIVRAEIADDNQLHAAALRVRVLEKGPALDSKFASGVRDPGNRLLVELGRLDEVEALVLKAVGDRDGALERRDIDGDVALDQGPKSFLAEGDIEALSEGQSSLLAERLPKVLDEFLVRAVKSCSGSKTLTGLGVVKTSLLARVSTNC